MDKPFNREHIGHVGNHRRNEVTRVEILVRHCWNHAWHFVILTSAGLPSIGAWELFIKPIMESSSTIPHA